MKVNLKKAHKLLKKIEAAMSSHNYQLSNISTYQLNVQRTLIKSSKLNDVIASKQAELDANLSKSTLLVSAYADVKTSLHKINESSGVLQKITALHMAEKAIYTLKSINSTMQNSIKQADVDIEVVGSIDPSLMDCGMCANLVKDEQVETFSNLLKEANQVYSTIFDEIENLNHTNTIQVDDQLILELQNLQIYL